MLNTVSDLRVFLALARGNGKTVGFVPTMGNLHQGHFDLVNKASDMSDVVVVSIFVNPMQFGPHEDFDAYPRTLEADCEALTYHSCDAVFAPTVREVYPKGVNTEIDLPSLSTILCGHHRPGHFKGVATVMTKLLNIVQPDVAVFGNKDYQQLQLIQTMVADLLIPVTIVGADTTRESSGLAMSSRNAYLSAEEKETAAMLYATLKRIGDTLRNDSQVSTTLRQEKKRLTAAGFVLDYLEIRDAQDLSKSHLEADSAVILVAAKLGRARLIDNLVIQLKH
ncbi:MAG: pantoate--beta-alanine ligase [Pseudomonadota bacterium]|nr:pantoate--beta-alanine ligase [Pseudomonadota bacterium]